MLLGQWMKTNRARNSSDEEFPLCVTYEYGDGTLSGYTWLNCGKTSTHRTVFKSATGDTATATDSTTESTSESSTTSTSSSSSSTTTSESSGGSSGGGTNVGAIVGGVVGGVGTLNELSPALDLATQLIWFPLLYSLHCHSRRRYRLLPNP